MTKIAASFALLTVGFLFSGTAANAKPKHRPSGIYGFALFNNNAPTPDGPQSYLLADCEIVIKKPRNDKIIARGHSDENGKFKIDLPPGKYIVFPLKAGYTGSLITDETSVTVWQSFYSNADATFNNGF